MSFSRRSCGGVSLNCGCSKSSPLATSRSVVLELIEELLRSRRTWFRFALRAIDLAVDAVEVADLVGVQIHADRNPLAPPAEHRIDEPVVFKPAGMAGMESRSDMQPAWLAARQLIQRKRRKGSKGRKDPNIQLYDQQASPVRNLPTSFTGYW